MKRACSMKLSFSVLKARIACCLLACAPALYAQQTPVDYVDPFIDTHRPRFFFFNSASRPFGMVNLSPDTRPAGWFSGYVYGVDSVYCFSHIHSWQMWGIPVMPVVGQMNGHLGMAANGSPFSHTSEVAKPGYHKLLLNRYRIGVELTSTTRSGFHKYTFPKSENSHILFDLGAPLADGETAYAETWKIDPSTLAGYQIMAATNRRPKETPVYFYARLSKPSEAVAFWKDGAVNEAKNSRISGKNIGTAFSFSTHQDEEVYLQVGISYVSVEQARLNLDTEVADRNFASIKQESFDVWNEMLGRIQVEGGTDTDKIKFYTDLWHSLIGRRILSDVDGKYMDMTGDFPRIRQVGTDQSGKPLFPHYNFDAWWGSQWSLNILWSMVYPEIMDGFCNTMVDMYKNGGLIPRGPSGGNYTYVMIGDPATPFFGAAYQKGIRNFDVETAYEGLRKNAFPGGIRSHSGYEHDKEAKGGGMDDYVSLGYVSADRTNPSGYHRDASVSMTLEYAYQDWALSELAKSLGKADDEKLFAQRAENYKNVFNPRTGYMQPRNRDGSFAANFDPLHPFGFCESVSAIYTYFVPHDPSGLISLLGGEKKLTQRLNEQFEKGETFGFASAKGEKDGFWIDYSNQPGTGMAHLFNAAGSPWLAQKWVRKVKESNNSITPQAGYKGDEDEGQMGALGVLLSIGLFDFSGGCGADPSYEITSPVFDKVTIKLNNNYYPGDCFIIETANNSASNMYIKEAAFNDRPWKTHRISHSDYSKGGVLKLHLSPTPNKKWGR